MNDARKKRRKYGRVLKQEEETNGKECYGGSRDDPVYFKLKGAVRESNGWVALPHFGTRVVYSVEPHICKAICIRTLSGSHLMSKI